VTWSPQGEEVRPSMPERVGGCEGVDV